MNIQIFAQKTGGKTGGFKKELNRLGTNSDPTRKTLHSTTTALGLLLQHQVGFTAMSTREISALSGVFRLRSRETIWRQWVIFGGRDIFLEMISDARDHQSGTPLWPKSNQFFWFQILDSDGNQHSFHDVRWKSWLFRLPKGSMVHILEPSFCRDPATQGFPSDHVAYVFITLW